MARAPLTERQELPPAAIGMVAELVPQAPAVEPEDRAGTSDVGHRVLQAGESLPARLGIGDMLRAFGISRATFYRRERRGDYADFLILPQRGPRAWSGALVQRWLAGESRLRPMFGRRRVG